MKKIVQLFCLGLVLVGCSTTPQDLEHEASAKSAVRTYPDNYQAVYKRIVDPAKRCSEGGFMFSPQASLNVDAQLYNELGFGEITYSLNNGGIRNYYWKAKVEKAGTGAKLTVYSGNTISNATVLNRILGWADGSTSC